MIYFQHCVELKTQLAEMLPTLCVRWYSRSIALAGAVSPLADTHRGMAGGPPLSLTLMLALTGCTLALVIGVLVVGFVLSIGRGKGNKDGEEKK